MCMCCRFLRIRYSNTVCTSLQCACAAGFSGLGIVAFMVHRTGLNSICPGNVYFKYRLIISNWKLLTCDENFFVNVILAHRIRISKILPWDRKSYLTHAILPRLSREGYIHLLYRSSRTWSPSEVTSLLCKSDVIM